MPADDQTTTIESSVVIVSQPAEERKKKVEEEEEEEIIVVEKQKSGEVRKQKKKKIIKQKSEEEVEVEIEYIGGGKRIIKKKITANRPDIDEEIIEEEFTKTLKPFEQKSERGMPVIIPSQFSESVPVGQVTQLQTDAAVPQSQVNVNLLPHSALTQEVINVQEKEMDSKDFKRVQAFAARSLDTLEPYQVTEHDVQIQPGDFKTTFKPDTSKASTSYSHNESVMVSETLASDGTSSIQEEITKQTQAKLTLILQEATNISETQASHSEKEIEKYDIPKTVQADKSFVSREGLSVFEVTEGQMEDKYNPNLRPVPLKPKVSVSSRESLIVSEVQAETKPDKYYPELIVPTEVATETVISQRQVVTSEMNAPELEGQYVAGRLPPTQIAGVGITSGETIVVQEHGVHEKEGVFSEEFKPDTMTASQNMTLLESVSVQLVDTQMPQNDFTVDEIEHKKAGVDFIAKESVVSTITTATEREGTYVVGQLPEGKSAVTSILCLETSEGYSTLVQESEGEFIPDKKPTAAIAERNVRPDEPVSVSEIHTADVPEEFTGTLKYRTDEAETRIVTQESKQILETFIQEKEGHMNDQIAPASYNVQKTYDEQQEIHVLETQVIESEGILKQFEFPETHKGKSVPTHLLQTSIVEETQPHNITGSLEQLKTENIVAKMKHDTFDETVIEEAIISENISSYEQKQIEQKQAALTLLEEEGLSITEVLIQDKEGTYRPKELPEQFYAKPDVLSQRVAIKSETLSELSTGTLTEEKPVLGQAKTEQTPMESLLITESQHVEKEGQFVKDIFPDTQKANVEINEGKQGIHVTQVVTNEAEQEYIKEEAPVGISATKNVCAQNVVVQSETVTVVHTDRLLEEERITGRAKKFAEPLQELIITESMATDVERAFEKDIIPYEKSVNIDVIAEQGVSVTEVITNEKEERLRAFEKPEERNAIVDVIEKNVAMQEETVANTELGDYKRISPTRDQAQTKHEALQHIVQSHYNVAEKEGDYMPDVRPDEKVAGFSLIEEQGVTVTLVQAEDKEKQLLEMEKPKEYTAKPEFDTQNVAITSEMIIDDALDKMESVKPKEAAAKSEQIPFESLITSEAVLSEKEGIYTEEFKPATHTALKDVELGEGITVTTITTGDREKLLDVAETPEMRTATSALTGHIVAESSEILVESSVSKLSRESPTKYTATTDHTLHESLVSMEASLAEKEGIFSEKILPESKVAGVAFVEGMPVTVTEVLANTKESEYTSPEQLEGKFAKPEIFGQKVAEKSEVVTEFGVGKVLSEKPEEAYAKKDQLTFESLIQTEVLLRESESEFSKEVVLDVHSAKPVYDEKRSVTITEITSGNTESVYSSEQKPQEHTATFDITGQEIAHKSEIVPVDTLGVFAQETVTSAAAQQEQTPFESIVQTETTLAETESSFTGDMKPETKKAGLIFEQVKGVTITSVMTNEKETEFTAMEKPEGKKAKPDILGHTIATVAEVHPEISTENLVIDEKITAKANKDHVVHESVLQSETSVLETEDTLAKDKQPESKQAKLDYIIERSVIVSQVTSGDFEDTYIAETLPEQKTALQDIGSGHEVAEQTQTFVSDSLQELKDKTPVYDKAKEDQNMFSSVIISENYVQETEQDFIGKFTPESKSPNISLEDCKKIHTVTEIFVGNKEGTVDKMDVPYSKTASPSVTGHEVAQMSEVLSEMSVGPIVPTSVAETLAKVEHIPYQSIIQSEANVKETEGVIDTELKYVTKSANLLMEERTSMAVTEVTAQDREGDLPSPVQPASTIAEPKFTGKEVAQSTEVLVDMSLSELSVQKPTEAIAKPEQDTFVSIISSQTTVAETEGEFDSKFTPETKTVQVNFEEGRGVTVTEVMTVDKEDEYHVSELPTGKQAVPEFITKEVAEKYEIISQTGIADYTEKSVQEKRATVGQSTFESIIQSEAVVRESEIEFKDTIKLDTKTAETNIELGKSVNVTQVIFEEQEGEFKPDEIQGKTATPHIPYKEPVQHSQVETHMNVQYFGDKLPEGTFARQTQGEFESIVVSQNIVQETEKQFESLQDIVEKRAQIGFTDVKGVTVSETITSDKEATLLPGSKVPGVTAVPDITGQEIAQKSFVTPEVTADELVTSKPQSAQGRLEQIPLETISVSESTVVEKEGKFESKFKPDSTIANVLLDERKSVTVTQIISDDTKSEYLMPDKPKEHKAEKNIISKEEIQQSEVVTLQSIQDIQEEFKTEPKKAREGHSTFESLVQTEISTHESEDVLKVSTLPSTVSASMSLQVDQEVTVTEVVPQEQESEKIIHGVAQEEVAKPEVVQRQVAMKTETLTDDTVGQFETDKLITSHLKPSQPDHQHSVTVTQIVTEDMEDEFVMPGKPQPHRAQKNIISNEEIQQSEIVTLQSTEEYQGTVKTERKVARQEQSTFESIVQTEISAHESEDLLKLGSLPSKVSAAIGLQVEQEVTVTEVVPQEREGEKIISDVVQEGVAKPDVVQRQVALKTETLTDDTIGEFEAGKVPSTTLKPSQPDQQHSVTVTQVVSEDMEDELVTPGKPQPHKAQKNIISNEEIQQSEVLTLHSVHKIQTDKTETKTARTEQSTFESVVQTEISAHESEDVLKVKSLPSSVTALVGLQLDQEVTVTEVVPQEQETEKVIPGVAQVVAKPDVIQRQVALKTETLTDDTVGDFEAGKIVSTSVKPSQPDQQHSLTVTQIVTEDAEGELVSMDKPEPHKAQKNVIRNEEIQQSEVVTLQSTGDIQETKKELRTAKKQQSTFESVIQTEVSTTETEDVLQTTKLPGKVSASVSMQFEQELTVTEVVPEEQEAEKVVPGLAQEIAKPDVVQRQVALKTETLTDDTVGEFEAGKIPRTTLKPSQPDQQHSVTVTQVVSEDMEEEFVSPDKPQTHKAQKNIISNEEIQQSEILTLQSIEEIQGEFKTEPKKAKAGRSTFESIVQTEISASEMEETLKVASMPGTVSAAVSLEVDQGITVTEIVPEEHETEKVVPGLAQQEIAKSDIIQRQVAMKSETLLEDMVSEFEADKVFATSLKPTQPVPQHGLIVTELRSTGELESVMPDKIIPSTRRASISLEQRETNLQVMEVYSHDREGEYIPMTLHAECGYAGIIFFLHFIKLS